MIQRQKEEEERLRRQKEAADRDAALARELAEQPSPPRASASSFAGPSRSVQNNAFTRILARSSQSSGSLNRSNDRVKPEPSEQAPAWDDADDESEPEEYRYQLSGTNGSSDIDDEGISPGRLRQPWRRPTSSTPLQPSFRPSSSLAGTGGPSRHASNVPPIELARQSSMARQEALARPQLFGLAQHNPPSGSGSPGPSRPGFLNDGEYFSRSAQSPFSDSLAAVIERSSRIDFENMLDGDGYPLSSRLVNFLDDYVNDPRKTEEEIQQLLSNIRPDMEIPEEERGETPEAMKYSLYPHQQLALKWMTNMEEGTNKGGILADDMGLGKTISSLALMVSRQSSDNIKVCVFQLGSGKVSRRAVTGPDLCRQT